MTIVPCRPVEDDLGPSFTTAGLINRSGGRYAYLLSICPPQVNLSRAKKVSRALEDAGHPVSPVVITQAIKVSDANARGQGVDEYAPGSRSAEEFAALPRKTAQRLQEIALARNTTLQDIVAASVDHWLSAENEGGFYPEDWEGWGHGK